MIDVSVIIVNWNTKDLLLDCIKSLIETTKKIKIEIIVVDNASSDGSPEAVQQNFPRVKIIVNKDNLGFARANNIGIMGSKGRYICLVNSDIKVINNALDQMISYMDNNPGVGVLGPKTLNADMTLRKNCRKYPSLWNMFCRSLGLHVLFPRIPFFSDTLMIYFDHSTIKKVNVLPGCFLLVRREALNDVGGLDENFFIYGEDKDWCKRFNYSGWDIHFFPSAEVIHFAGQSSSAAPIRFIIERLKANSYYWKKHHKKITYFLYVLILIFHYFIRLIGSSVLYIFKPSRRRNNAYEVKGAIVRIKYLLFGNTI